MGTVDVWAVPGLNYDLVLTNPKIKEDMHVWCKDANF